MNDPINVVRSHADVIRAIVVTRYFNLEGDIHFPKLGKEGRRLSNLLNSERKFLAMTNVHITNRVNGTRDSKLYSFIEVNIEAIEFVQPLTDGKSPDEPSQIIMS